MKNAATIPALALVAALMTGPAFAVSRDTPDVQLRKILGDRVAGSPQRCISLSGPQSSQVVDRTAIVYRVDTRFYVNIPPTGAEWLRSGDILVTRTFGSQLCAVDTVTLLDRNSRFPRGSVILGSFIPYDKPKRSH